MRSYAMATSLSLLRLSRLPLLWRASDAVASLRIKPPIRSESSPDKKAEVFTDIARNPLLHCGLGWPVQLLNPAELDGSDDKGMQCGRGDKKTKRGKRFKGSFGKCRPKRDAIIKRLRVKWELPPGAPLPGRHEIA